MKKIKIGDRMRNVETQEEVTVARAGNFLCAEHGIWRNPQGYELIRTKLIPFQSEKWTPEMTVVDLNDKSVRVLCVDGPNNERPIIGIDYKCLVWHYKTDELRFIVILKTKTKTLYGYWNEMENCGFVYTDEIKRNDMFEYQEKEYDHTLIKFQTEIEL